jgi:hypothetical protein
VLSVDQRHLQDARKIDPVLASSLVVSPKSLRQLPWLRQMVGRAALCSYYALTRISFREGLVRPLRRLTCRAVSTR